MTDQDIIQQQIAYYRARAGEYDEWFYRLGRYDRGAELNQAWFDAVGILMQALQQVGQPEQTLELACGTGIWTQQLASISQQVTALDASLEVMNLNRAKLRYANVRFQQLDIFNWEPDREYDLVFFSFWLSHVPPVQLKAFLTKVWCALKPGGQVFMIDSLPEPTSSATNHAPYDDTGIYHQRKLNDGQEFTIFKVFYEPSNLEQTLAECGIQAAVKTAGRYFWYAHGLKV